MAKRVFADTFYFIALFSPRDAAHEWAQEASDAARGHITTTDAVMLEFADAMCAPPDRMAAAAAIRDLWELPGVDVRPLSRVLLQKGMELYAKRPDKSWSLTDCVSFVVMREEGIHEALTGDTHFEQAGFRILFPQSD
jgi:predicted nucleic acid-binding protein